MTKINLPSPECKCTGTGNIFNLIMRMTVSVPAISSPEGFPMFSTGYPARAARANASPKPPESVFVTLPPSSNFSISVMKALEWK